MGCSKLAARVVLALGAAIVATPSPSSTQAPPTASPYPIRLVTGEGSGPAIYLGTDERAPAIGYISPGVEVELTDAPVGGRAPVRVRGSMRVRGFLDVSRLTGRIVRRGRIRGTPVYVTGGDSVVVHGVGPDQRADVSIRVTVAGTTRDFRGSYPLQGIGLDTPADTPDVSAPGTPCTLASTGPLALAEQPGGAATLTLSAGTIPCRDLGIEGGAYKVLLGTGPYLAGYVSVAPTPAAEPRDVRVDARFRSPPTGPAGTVPERLRHDAQLPLVRIAAGTRVVHERETIAILDEVGYARIVERHDGVGEVDVFVAIDDRVAVRGIVETSAILDTVVSDAD